MRDAPPPRLRQDAELGALLSATDASAQVAADRLARSADAVRAAIAAGDRQKPIAWWKVTVPIALVLGGFFVVRPLLGGDAGTTPPPAPAITTDAAPASADAAIALAAPPDAPP